MYSTFGADQVSSVTELRQETNDILEHSERTGEAILIQRNNEPVAVLLSIETYQKCLALRKGASQKETPPKEDEPEEENAEDVD